MTTCPVGENGEIEGVLRQAKGGKSCASACYAWIVSIQAALQTAFVSACIQVVVSGNCGVGLSAAVKSVIFSSMYL